MRQKNSNHSDSWITASTWAWLGQWELTISTLESVGLLALPPPQHHSPLWGLGTRMEGGGSGRSVAKGAPTANQRTSDLPLRPQPSVFFSKSDLKKDHYKKVLWKLRWASFFFFLNMKLKNWFKKKGNIWIWSGNQRLSPSRIFPQSPS